MYATVNMNGNIATLHEEADGHYILYRDCDCPVIIHKDGVSTHIELCDAMFGIQELEVAAMIGFMEREINNP